jgi:hypothetical protein
MFNIFDDAKWHEKLRFILILPFIIIKEIYDSWREKRRK